jgi:DNA-binding FadR family transcriptional regulator
MKKLYKSMKKEIGSKLPVILVDHGEKRELMKLFSVSHVTVREALRGSIATRLAQKIRKVAVERGGLIINMH